MEDQTQSPETQLPRLPKGLETLTHEALTEKQELGEFLFASSAFGEKLAEVETIGLLKLLIIFLQNSSSTRRIPMLPSLAATFLARFLAFG